MSHTAVTVSIKCTLISNYTGFSMENVSEANSVSMTIFPVSVFTTLIMIMSVNYRKFVQYQWLVLMRI